MIMRVKAVIAISSLTLSVLIAGLCLYSISGILNKVDKAGPNLRLTPLLSKNVWGAKIETANKSRQFFAGIQKQIATIDMEANDTLVVANAGTDDGKRPNNLQHYKFEIGKVGILLKVISYEHPGPEKRNDPPRAGELKHLNYIVESGTCRSCSKDDMVLLGGNEASDSAMPGAESHPKSVFGLLIQVYLK